MSKNEATLSPSPIVPESTPSSLQIDLKPRHMHVRSGAFHNVGPMAAIAAIIIVGWYALGLYDNIPFAQQIMGTKALSSDVLHTALNLPMPFVPLPHQVIKDFFTSLNYPLNAPRGLWLHMGTTGMEAILGLLGGTLLGVLIATAFVHSRPIEAAFLPYVIASQTVPILAVAPIVIAILGITLAAKVVVAAYLAFFSVTISTVKGFKSADPLAHELMRSYAANTWQIYWKLRFPVALPYLMTGLKVAATASLVGAIIAEMPFGSATGLGARLLVATTYNLTIQWWSIMLVCSVLGVIAFSAISLLERLVVKRRKSQYWRAVDMKSSLPLLTPWMRQAFPPLLAFLVIVVMWEKVLNVQELPPPSKILSAFNTARASLVDDTVATFWEEALRGYLAGCGLAFLVATLCVRFPFLRRGLVPYAIVSNSIPIIAFAPVIIFWFGFEWQSKAIVALILTFFPMLVNTIAGLTSYDTLSRELMRSYAASGWTVFWKLQLPNALPYIFNGLKICTTLSMIAAVIAEQFPGPNRGLGFKILDRANISAWADVWAAVIIACAIGIIFYVIVLILERTLTFWHVSYRRR